MREREKWKIIGRFMIVAFCILTGCGEAKESKGDLEEHSVAHEIVRMEEEIPTFPALREKEGIVIEGADNPAGALQEIYSSAMVQVRAGELMGSGVIVASDERYVFIATAAHVLDEMEGNVKIVFEDGFTVETGDISRLDPQDIAVLKIKRADLMERGEEGTEDHGKNYHVVILAQEAFDDMKKGDLVIAMGSKSGVAEDAYAGVVTEDYVFLEDFGANMVVAEVYVTPGMSGGGLFDMQGRLLGIICGVSEEGEVAVSSVLSLLTLELGK